MDATIASNGTFFTKNFFRDQWFQKKIFLSKFNVKTFLGGFVCKQSLFVQKYRLDSF